MSLFLAAAAAVVVPATQIDLASPTIYVSKEARSAIASGMAQRLACIDLPTRSRKYRTACLTPAEWQAAATRAEFDRRRASQWPEAIQGLPNQPVPAQSSLYQSGPR